MKYVEFLKQNRRTKFLGLSAIVDGLGFFLRYLVRRGDAGKAADEIEEALNELRAVKSDGTAKFVRPKALGIGAIISGLGAFVRALERWQVADKLGHVGRAMDGIGRAMDELQALNRGRLEPSRHSVRKTGVLVALVKPQVMYGGKRSEKPYYIRVASGTMVYEERIESRVGTYYALTYKPKAGTVLTINANVSSGPVERIATGTEIFTGTIDA